jgi:hypothetical protein
VRRWGGGVAAGDRKCVARLGDDLERGQAA